jgi:hypothetical protein
MLEIVGTLSLVLALTGGFGHPWLKDLGFVCMFAVFCAFLGLMRPFSRMRDLLDRAWVGIWNAMYHDGPLLRIITVVLWAFAIPIVLLSGLGFAGGLIALIVSGGSFSVMVTGISRIFARRFQMRQVIAGLVGAVIFAAIASAIIPAPTSNVEELLSTVAGGVLLYLFTVGYLVYAQFRIPESPVVT